MGMPMTKPALKGSDYDLPDRSFPFSFTTEAIKSAGRLPRCKFDRHSRRRLPAQILQDCAHDTVPTDVGFYRHQVVAILTTVLRDASTPLTPKVLNSRCGG